MAIAFLACGRMLLCGEAGFKDSSGKRRYGWNEKIGASPFRCLRLMGDDKLPTSYTVLQFITPPSAFLLASCVYALNVAEMAGAAKNLFSVLIAPPV